MCSSKQTDNKIVGLFFAALLSSSYDSKYIIQDECDRLTAVAMKQALGRQVVSTLPLKHILLLQHLHEPPSPVSTAKRMWLTSGRIRRAGAGPCTLVTTVVAVALAKTSPETPCNNNSFL